MVTDHPTKLPTRTQWAVGALLVNAFVWGVSWWPFRVLQDHGLHPLWTTAIVYGAATICITLFKPAAWQLLLRYPGLGLLAIGSGLTNICFNWAVSQGDVVRVVLLFYLMPAWSVLLAWPLLGERPSAGALMRLLLALAGVGLVLKQADAPWPLPQTLVDYLAILGGLCFALVNIMLLKLRDTPSEARMLAMFSGAAVMSTVVVLWGGQSGWVPSFPAVKTSWLVVAGVLALAFLVSNLALQYGAARLRSNTTALVMLSEILFASLSSIALGAAVLDARTLWGGALIVAACVWAAKSDH